VDVVIKVGLLMSMIIMIEVATSLLKLLSHSPSFKDTTSEVKFHLQFSREEKV
jgi:hypothetical protein